MIHYHGTPLSPRSELLKMAGKHLCVSFSEPRDAQWALTHAQSVMWDNGAFSAYTQKKYYSLVDFYAWVEPLLGHPHWAVIPDVIDGGVELQRDLHETWPFRKDLGSPVWHLHLPIKWLLELADNYHRVCFGSSGQFWEVGSDSWCRRVDEAFNALAQRHSQLPWIHMLRGMNMGGDIYPFASTDSVNVARNYKDARMCPERMARRIDAVQCPIKWHRAWLQDGLALEGGFYEKETADT